MTKKFSIFAISILSILMLGGAGFAFEDAFAAAPGVEENISGVLGSNDWYTSDVDVSFVITGNTTSISGDCGPTGLDVTKINADTAFIIVNCTADNAGEITVVDVVIKRDTADPVPVVLTRLPGPNGNGWNNETVNVTYDCSDALSGVDAGESDLALDSVSGQGENQSTTATCVDEAGNDADVTQSNIDIDLTNPVLTSSQLPGPNGNGWNNSDVTVTFGCTDALSDVDSFTGPILDNTDGIQGHNGLCTDNAGNTDTLDADHTVQLDTADPVPVVLTRLPGPNGFGWNNETVNVTYDCSDALSGVDTGESDLALDSVSGQGENQSTTATCVDEAGNDADVTQSNIDIDLTDPLPVVLTRLPGPNGFGWNNETVNVTYDCSDALSGVDAGASDLALDSVPGEGEGQSTTATCVDEAGNDADVTQSNIDIDLTDPVLTVSHLPAANGAGWNNSDVTVDFSCTDALSDVASVTGDTVDSSEAATAESHPGLCTDKADNTHGFSHDVFLDKTPPVVVTAPTNQRHEAVTQNAAFTTVDYTDYTVNDPLSGEKSKTCTGNDASTVSTTGGSFSKGITNVTCNATDIADNTNTNTILVISIAEIIIDEICVNAVCVGVSPDGTGTTSVDALWGAPGEVKISGTIWATEAHLPGTPAASNLVTSWGANEPIPDTPSDPTALPGDEDVGKSFTFTHNYSGPADGATEYTLPEEILVTMTGSTITSNDNAEVNVKKHVTESELILAAAGEKWDHTLAGNTVTLTDTSESPNVGVADKLYNFSDLGVAAGQSATTDDGTVDPLGVITVALQAGLAQSALDGPTQPVTATFTEDAFYLGSTNTKNLNLNPHIVEVALGLSADNIKWDHILADNTVTITDTNVVPGTNSGAALAVDLELVSFVSDSITAGHEINLGPLTLDTETSLISSVTVEIDFQAETATQAQTLPTNDVVSTHTLGQVYKGATGDATDTDPLTLTPHIITLVTTTDDDVLWDHAFSMETIITDTEWISSIDSGSAATIDPRVITYSGPGVAGEDEQSHTADTRLGETATTGSEMLQGGEASASSAGVDPDDIVSTIVNGTVYTGAASPATHTTAIDIRPHDSSPSLDFLPDLVGGTAFTPSGFMTDDDRVLFDDPANVAALGAFGAVDSNFVRFDTGSFAGDTVNLSGTGIGTPINPTIRGFTITDPNASFDNNGFVDVVKLKVGGTITLPEDSVAAFVEIRNLDSGDNATFSVTTNDPDPFEFVAGGTDLSVDAIQPIPNYSPAVISQGNGIIELALVGLFTDSGDDYIEISGISTTDPEGEPQVIHSANVTLVPSSERVLDKKNSVTFIDGAFHDIVPTDIEKDSNLEVILEYLGSDQYNGSGPVSGTFDTIFSSWGVGGDNFDLAPDTGAGFTSVACGVDVDTDSLCDGWDFHQLIEYASANGNLEYDIPAGANRYGADLLAPALQHKDVYVEIDYMEGHKPDEIALRDVITAYFNSDTDNIVGTGINLNIFVDEEIPHVDQLNVWTDDDNDLTNDFQSIKSRHFGTVDERAVLGGDQSSSIAGSVVSVTGLDITTPTGRAHDQGTITIQERIEVSGHTSITLDSISWAPGTTPTGELLLLLGSTSRSITQESAGVYIIQADIPYKAFVAADEDGIGTIKFNLTTDGDIDTSSTYKNSPIIFSNLTNVKAYIYHYFIWAHSIGECGPSGIAETDGNDGIVALGCNFEVAEAGDATDLQGNDRTVGSRQEQAGTFAHELGHNMGLLHGGPRVTISDGVEVADSTINCKPNYNSVMSYARQIPGPAIGLLSLGQFSAAYSEDKLPDLDETALDELLGIDTTIDTTIIYGAVGSALDIRKAAVYTSPEPAIKINWDGDGVFDASSVAADINNLGFDGCEASPGQSYSDHDDWNNLNFNFRGATGQAFDGVKGDPKKIADYTPVLANEIKASGFYYTGTFDPIPADGTGDFKLGSTIPFKFQIWTCNPHLETPTSICVDEFGVFGLPEGPLSTNPVDPNETLLELVPDEMIFLQVTKTSDGTVLGGDTVVDITTEEGDFGFFTWNGDHYQFNWDTKQLLGETKGKGKKSSGIGGEYSLLAIILQEGVASLLVDLENPFYIPDDADRAEPLCDNSDAVHTPPACYDEDVGFPVSMHVTLVD